MDEIQLYLKTLPVSNYIYLFDAVEYIRLYPEVKSRPAIHYVTIGVKQNYKCPITFKGTLDELKLYVNNYLAKKSNTNTIMNEKQIAESMAITKVKAKAKTEAIAKARAKNEAITKAREEAITKIKAKEEAITKAREQAITKDKAKE